MPDPIGVTFAPTPENAATTQKNWQTAGGAPQAVQILSLHVPKFAGVRALSPDALLQGQPHEAVAGVVDSVLRDLGHAPQPAGNSQESMGLADLLRQVMQGGTRFEPTPHVTPGVQPTSMTLGPMQGLTTRPTTPPLTNIQAPMAAPDLSPWAGSAQGLFDQHR